MSCVSSGLAHQIAGLPQGVHSLEWQGFPLRVVRQPWGDLAISLYGAQVLWFQPAGQAPVLWVTDKPAPVPKPIRGGVPLCWPWFAEPLDGDSAKPFHGVARTVEWHVSDESYDDTGGSWALKPSVLLWPGLDLTLVIHVSDKAIRLILTTNNVGDVTLDMTQALHTYLAISSRKSIHVEGLDGALYADKNRDFGEFSQSGDITIDEATDRIYQSSGDVLLKDAEWKRGLKVSKKHSLSTVVWNAGEGAATVADIGLDQVDGYLCIEAANTRQYDKVVLKPNQTAVLETTISVEPYLA